MKRPLVAVVSGYAIGLLLGEVFQPPLAILFAASFGVLLLSLALKKFRPFFIWLLLAFAGWTNLVSRTAVVSPFDLRALLGDEPAIVNLRGVLTETPRIKIVESDDQE